MTDHYKEVCEFNRDVIKYPQPEKVELTPISEATFMIQAVKEELREFAMSHYEDQDVVGSIDAIIDLVYFAYGQLYKMGVTNEQFHKIFSLVHRCNMTKVKGIKETRGHENDAIKPVDWVAPEKGIKEIIEC